MRSESTGPLDDPRILQDRRRSITLPQSPTSATEAKARPVDVTIAPEGDTTVRLGGPPIRFRVTLANHGADIAKLGMVVSLGHCSCGPLGASMMADGPMRMLDPQTNAW